MRDFFVARTCTRVSAGKPKSCALEELRDHDAYVLLGAPGSGKTEAFEHEADKEGGCYVTARDFIVLNRSEWCNTTLFIDGLDEVRAGAVDGRQPFDAIRAKLDRLSRPRLRLSCRTVDWYGENDGNNLESVAPNGVVSVFQLDPLSDDAIRECLERGSNVDDIEQFQRTAKTKGVDFLLSNPLSLDMLAKLAMEGTWPKTRTQLFDVAARKLLLECYQEHILAEHHSLDDLIDAAGEMCAELLLSGCTGYTRLGSGSSDCPGLDEIPKDNRALLNRALGTSLFREETSGCIIPLHAQFAEFLAGRYLKKLIADGLPLRRILALMTDGSGAIAVGLRGLVAWLAAHSKLGRQELITRDPLGVALNGDIHGFSRDEKIQLLEHLKRVVGEHPWYRILEQADSTRGIWTIPELGDLAVPAMEEQLQGCLGNLIPGNNGDTSFVWVLLEAIRHGTAQHGLADPMMQIVRNSQWEYVVREHALENYIQITENDGAASLELLSLLQDIESGQISDPDDQLTGHLLKALFPAKLSAIDVLHYLRQPKRQRYYGRYRDFWHYGIVDPSVSLELRAELLDVFVEQYGQLRNKFPAEPAYHGFHAIPAKLLADFLKKGPSQVELPRLFMWLGTAAWNGNWNYLPREVNHISAWLTQHPEEYKALLKIGWEHCAEQPECIDLDAFRRCMWTVEYRFFDAPLQEDLTRWYLDQSIIGTNRIIKEYLIRKVADAVHLRQSSGSLTAEAVRKKISHDTFLLEKFRARLTSREVPDSDHQTREYQSHKKQIRQLDSHMLEQYEIIKRHETDLRENCCAPGVLHFLAQAYWGEFFDIPEATPRVRLSHFLNKDTVLVKAALYGLHRSIDRDDLPDAAEIIRLGARNKMPALTLPFLIGFEKMAAKTPLGSTSFDQNHIRLALAICYTYPIRPNWEDQEWYKEIVAEQPQVVADILIQSVKSDLRFKKDCQGKLYALAFSEDHAVVARLVALPLLRSFRPRAAVAQFPSLRVLLFAAILWSEKKPFLRLIKHKLGLSSITVAQRVCWLIAGFWTAPEIYSKKLESYVDRDDLRSQQVIEFIAKAPENMLSRCRIKSLHLLVQLLGPSCTPWFYNFDHSRVGAQRVTSAMTVGEYVETWIKQLATDLSQETTQVLEKLAIDDRLRAWKQPLDDALYKQKELCRKTSFRYSDIRQVVDTLRNRKPANAADLAALTFDKLTETGRRIRDGSPAEWRQYWNLDSRRKPQKPRHENDCRDTLLSHLNPSLQQLGIDAQPEGNYADDKRADIRVSYDSLNVPVEIKKSSHRDLWTAIRQQLIGQYSRHPDADGYGIYLVFWLGKKRCQSPSFGIRPENAEELQRQLQSMLTEEQSRKISICVLDIEPAQPRE